MVDSPVELAEVRQGSSAHPDNEVLVDEAGVVRVLGVKVLDGHSPVLGLDCVSPWIVAFRVAELDCLIRVPGDAGLDHGHVGVSFFQLELVAEERVGDGAAGRVLTAVGEGCARRRVEL